MEYSLKAHEFSEKAMKTAPIFLGKPAKKGK